MPKKMKKRRKAPAPRGSASDPAKRENESGAQAVVTWSFKHIANLFRGVSDDAGMTAYRTTRPTTDREEPWPYSLLTRVTNALRSRGKSERARAQAVKRREERRRRVDTADARPAARRERERKVVGVMAHEFEKTLGVSSTVLLVALVLVGGYATWKQDRTMIVAAVIIAVLFILAVVRQSVLAWRTKRGYFGSSEHEVRELLAFAMRHPTPQDFFGDNGHLLPAFDVALREARASAVGQPQVANT